MMQQDYTTKGSPSQRHTYMREPTDSHDHEKNVGIVLPRY